MEKRQRASQRVKWLYFTRELPDACVISGHLVANQARGRGMKIVAGTSGE